jgi:hypothetical protein
LLKGIKKLEGKYTHLFLLKLLTKLIYKPSEISLILSIPRNLMNYTPIGRQLTELPDHLWRNKRPVRRMTLHILQIIVFVQPYFLICTALLPVLYNNTSRFCTALLPVFIHPYSLMTGQWGPKHVGNFKILKYYLCVFCWINLQQLYDRARNEECKIKTSTHIPRMCDYCWHYTGAGDVVSIVLWIPLAHKNRY